MRLYFWRRIGSAGESGDLDPVAALAAAISAAIPDLEGKVWAYALPRGLTLPKAACFLISADDFSLGPGSKLERWRVQISVWDDDQNRLAELTQRVLALDNKSVRLKKGFRNQTFFSLKYESGPTGGEDKRETQSQRAQVRHFMFRLCVNVDAPMTS